MVTQNFQFGFVLFTAVLCHGQGDEALNEYGGGEETAAGSNHRLEFGGARPSLANHGGGGSEYGGGASEYGGGGNEYGGGGASKYGGAGAIKHGGGSEYGGGEYGGASGEVLCLFGIADLYCFKYRQSTLHA